MKKENKISGMKLACAIGETILAIPILGAMIIIGLLWTPLLLMGVLHIVTLSLTSKERKMAGNILGIVASAIGWIPFVGFVLHILAAVFCWIEAFKTR
jgi:hypothetical protein